jgi:hypothetical protein
MKNDRIKSFGRARKSLKDALRFRGLDCYSPRECFKSACQEGLIRGEEL